ncbi:MAG: hypothetical protein H6918_12520 [Sphingomonadaceae bacterium]|nr:hypothetical protein [Sphingomonadaceae bacterium]
MGLRHKAAPALVAFCFAVGASAHARDILLGGWLPYHFAPLPMNWFWTLLLPLDLAVVGLIVLRKVAAALWLGLAIMIADVSVNAYALVGLGFPAFAYSLPLQAAFLGYLLGAMPFLLRDRVGSVRPE